MINRSRPSPTAAKEPLRAEEARESEERTRNTALFSQIIEQAPGGVYVVDAQFRVAQMNAASLPFFVSAQPLIGRDFDEVLEIVWGPEEGRRIAIIFRHTLETGERYVSPRYSAKRNDLGVEQAFDWETQRVTLLNGENGVVCYFQDVTARVRTEAAMRLLNERFDLAVKCSRAVLWQQDLELRFIWLHNPAPGIDRSDAAGKREADLLERAEDVTVIEGLKREVLRSGVAMRKEFSPKIQGVEHCFELLMEPLRDAAGLVTGLTGAAIDITELKRAETAHRETARDYRALADASLEIPYRMSADWSTMLPLDGRALFASSDRPLADWTWMDHYLPRDEHASVRQAISDAIARKNLFEMEHRVLRLDGSIGWIRSRAVPILDQNKEIIAWFGAASEITERKEAEERLQLAISGSDLGTWHWNIRTGGLDWSERCLKLFGFPPGTAMTYEKFLGALHHEDRARADDAVRAALQDGAEYHIEFRTVWPDGSVHWVVSLGRAYRDHAGEPTRMEGVALDVSPLRHAETARYESERNYRALAEASYEVAYRMSADWSAMQPLDGRQLVLSSDQPLTNWAWLDQNLPPDEHARVREAINQAIAGKTLFELEHRVRRPDGSTGWTLSRAVPILDENKVVTAWFGAASDITERKQAEEAVRESEAQLREQVTRLALLVQITRAISSHLDFQTILTVVTNNLEDNLPVDFCCVGLFDEQVTQCEVARVGLKSAPLAREMALREHTVISLDCVALTQVARGDLSYLSDVREMAFPFPQRLAQGGLRALVLAPLAVEGKVIGFLLVARREARSFLVGECEFLQQLSEHVALASHQAKLHQSLRVAYDALRQTQQAAVQRERLRALGQMATGITHDISNAISPVTLYTASLLEHEPNLSVRARDYLQIIHQSVQNVADTIARIREFYRQGESKVMLTPIRLNDVAAQALELTRARWSDGPHERGIVIQTEVRLAEDLPDIMGVESEIRDAIVNLIFNAVDAMPGGGALTIRTVIKPISPGTTSGAPGAPPACLELSDTGIGMDEDTRRRCVEPFFTTKGEQGTGLGLAMVYGMIKRHGAEFEIQSTPGQGTMVRLSFPVSAVASVGGSPPEEEIPKPAHQRILFIDDDPFLTKSMRDTLATDGHTVVTAAGGQEGILAFVQAQERKAAFTVVITDLGMPHVDGRKVAHAVKAASPFTPVIMLTGWGPRLTAEGDTPAHVDRLLNKPPLLHELRETLAACCPPSPSQPAKA